MMRGLREFYKQEDSKIGLPSHGFSPTKKVKSPNSSETKTTPGYDNDILFEKDFKKVEFDDSQLTSTHWFNQRDNNLAIKTVNRIHPAVADVPNSQKEVREI